MNAQEAREKALSITNEKTSKQLSTILSLIDAAAGKGDFTVSYNGYILPAVRKYLEGEGYEVGKESSGGFNETLIKISW